MHSEDRLMRGVQREFCALWNVATVVLWSVVSVTAVLSDGLTMQGKKGTLQTADGRFRASNPGERERASRQKGRAPMRDRERERGGLKGEIKKERKRRASVREQRKRKRR